MPSTTQNELKLENCLVVFFSFMEQIERLTFKLIFGQVTSASFGSIIALYVCLTVTIFFFHNLSNIIRNNKKIDQFYPLL